MGLITFAVINSKARPGAENEKKSWHKYKHSRRLRWVSYVSSTEEGRSSFKILTDKPIGKIPLGRPTRRWKDKIRMD
jgi:hypothetical protein